MKFFKTLSKYFCTMKTGTWNLYRNLPNQATNDDTHIITASIRRNYPIGPMEIKFIRCVAIRGLLNMIQNIGCYVVFDSQTTTLVLRKTEDKRTLRLIVRNWLSCPTVGPRPSVVVRRGTILVLMTALSHLCPPCIDYDLLLSSDGRQQLLTIDSSNLSVVSGD